MDSKGFFKRMIWILAGTYILFGLFLWWKQRSVIYYPCPISNPGPQITIKNQGESLNIGLIHPDQPAAIIYFGGNAECVAGNRQVFAEVFPNHTIYLVNYRGYAGSSGTPSQEGILSDALALFDHIQPKHNSVSVIGRSLGSGPATYLASQRNVNTLGLITPFDSMLNVAQKKYWIYPVFFILKDTYRNDIWINNVKAPIFILAAQNDRIVPINHAKNLFEEAKKVNGKVSFETIRAGHNFAINEPNFIDWLENLNNKNER